MAIASSKPLPPTQMKIPKLPLLSKWKSRGGPTTACGEVLLSSATCRFHTNVATLVGVRMEVTALHVAQAIGSRWIIWLGFVSCLGVFSWHCICRRTPRDVGRSETQDPPRSTFIQDAQAGRALVRWSDTRPSLVSCCSGFAATATTTGPAHRPHGK